MYRKSRTLRNYAAVLLTSAIFCAPSGSHAQDAAPNLGSFESLLNSLPQPNQPAQPSPAQQGNAAQQQAVNPGLALPQASGQQAPAQVVLPGLTPEEVGGMSREEQIQLRATKEKKKFYNDAYNIAVDTMFPLKPEEIRRFMEIYDENRQAIDTPMFNRPKPEVGVKTISLDPGHIPDSIDVAMGTVTTVSIVDVTGQPWPVQDMTWAGDFDIIQPGNGENVFRITPTTHFAHGNLSMRLVGLQTPIVLSLNTGRDRVYYRLDLRVPDYGPAANAPLINTGLSITAGNSTLATILDGLPPERAERLDVNGADARTRAYKYNGMVYVRTPLTLLSPGWSGSVKSADGMNVYELANAPVVLLSDNGKMVRATIRESSVE